jgi:hypothetical protein
MHLLYSQAVPGPEFASLSILHKSDVSGGGGGLTCHVGDPLLLPSPLSTISQASCIDALTELHLYINSLFQNVHGRSNNHHASNRFTQEDETRILGKDSSSSTHLFRPQACHGMALYYSLIKDKKRISRLFPLVKSACRSTALSKQPAGLEKDVNAVVLCVGVAGMPSVFGTTPLINSMPRRIQDCVHVLCSCSPAGSDGTVAATDVTAMRSLLTTVLLTEDGDRVTNAMVSASNQLMLVREEESGGGLLGSTKRRSVENAAATALGEDENPLLVRSADQARVTVERLAVLSVCDSDTQFRKFEGRNKEPEKGKKRLRKTTKDADMDGFDFRGEARSRRNTVTSSAASLSGSTSTTVPSSDASFSMRSTASSGSNLALRGPKKDTSRAINRAPLLRPSKDDAGRNRRSTVGYISSAGNRSRNFSSRISNGGGSGFGNSTHSKQSLRSHSDAASLSSSRSHSQASKQQDFDPFQDIAAHTPAPGYGPDLFDTTGGNDLASMGSNGVTKVFVNIALNEDLTCFYKLSKMSSCTVEGVVQVQVKSNVDQGVPFFLLLRDPSNHIQSIQENKKFADNMADSLASEPVSTRPDYMFTVSVPKGDNYFPVMRYKCGNELRPVPIVSQR